MSDERLAHLETQPYLRGVVFERTTYRRYREGWDHDHCAACWAKFAVQGSDREPVEREGYTTTAAYQHGPQYEWVCVTCFQDFKAEMGWTEV